MELQSYKLQRDIRKDDMLQLISEAVYLDMRKSFIVAIREGVPVVESKMVLAVSEMMTMLSVVGFDWSERAIRN